MNELTHLQDRNKDSGGVDETNMIDLTSKKIHKKEYDTIEPLENLKLK